MSTALLTIQETALAVSTGQLSCRESIQAALDRADALNPELNALLQTLPDSALSRADQLDAHRAAGSATPPLAGVPVVIKDNICLEGSRTTCASNQNTEPPPASGAKPAFASDRRSTSMVNSYSALSRSLSSPRSLKQN